MAIYSFANFGFEGSLVKVEVDLRRGIPAVDIVGLADNCVKASRERVRSAFSNSGFAFPTERVLISLSPADIKKDGGGFDLPVALEIWKKNSVTTENIDDGVRTNMENDVLVMGELEMNGNVRTTMGVYAALQSAVSAGIKYAIIPVYATAEIPDGIKVAKVDCFQSAVEALLNIGNPQMFIENKPSCNNEILFEEVDESFSLDNIKQLNGLKYAMTVAVAGKHNLLAWGKPGCGKTLVLQRMPNIMPKLTDNEKHIVDRLYSLAVLGETRVVKDGIRPFRMPHQTASIEGICGGGINCRPGEISLAHNGVLFLDEAMEFRSSVLQMLRVPIETNNITLARAGRSTIYPADFQLVMATNPCPCGNYESNEHVCLCSMRTIEQYWKKLSEPLLDRIEIRYNCNAKDNFPELTQNEMREMIKRAWERQIARQGKLNARLSKEELEEYAEKNAVVKKWCDDSFYKYGTTIRTINAILKVAMTIADMNGTEVTEDNLKTAKELHALTVLEA